MAAVLGGFAVLLLAIGALAVTASGVAPLVFATVAFTAAVLLALMSWGTLHSTRPARAHACGCGHDHDPAELDVAADEDDACGRDECAHDCANCVFAASRASTAS